MALTVTYHGGQCLLAEEKQRGADAQAALFFPHTKTSRARTLESKAQIILTEPSAKKTGSDAFRIDTAGEYDVHRFMIRGITLGNEAAYVLDSGSLVVGYVTGGPGRALKEDEVEALGTVDVLAVPVPFTPGKDLVAGLGEFVRAVEPKAVIAMTEGTKERKAIAGELGLEGEKVTKLSLAQKDLPDEGSALYFLNVA